MYVNTNIISQHTHTHMSEVEVYSVNKLKFWAMDKNVVGKKIRGREPLTHRVTAQSLIMGTLSAKWPLKMGNFLRKIPNNGYPFCQNDP